MDVTASLFLADGRECKVITGIDDHSRFCVIATVVTRAAARAVCLAFTTAMAEYGIPAEVLSDNGKPFTGGSGGPDRPGAVRADLPGERHHPAADQAPIATTTGKMSGCTRRCSWSCSTSAGPSPGSRTPKRRSTPGARITTPGGRTSP